MRKTTPFTTKLCSAQRLTSEKKVFLEKLYSKWLTFPSFCAIHSKVILFAHQESIIRSQSINLYLRCVSTRLNLDSKWTLWYSPTPILDIHTVAAWSLRYILDRICSVSVVFDIHLQIRAGGRRYRSWNAIKRRVIGKKKLLDILEAMESVRFGMK